MSETTTETTTEATTEATTEPVEGVGGVFAPDDLENVPADRLAAMLRDKRKDEQAMRERLRVAEGTLEGSTATVAAFQRAAFHEAAKGRGAQESAMGDVDAAVDLSSVLADDGTVDPAKVDAALADLKTKSPHYFGQIATRSGTEFHGTGESTTPVAAWGDVLAP